MYNYGDIKREDRADVAHWLPAEGLDLYVCIRVIPEQGRPFISWVGVIPAEQLQVFGTTIDLSGTHHPAGDQPLTAYGLEYLLQRRQVPGAWIRKDDATANQIGWSPIFNQRFVSGLQELGNRSGSKIEAGGSEVAYGFGGSSVWSHRDIVEYLLHYSNPLSPSTTEPLFRLAPTAEAEDPEIIQFFDNMKARVPQEGRTLSSIFASLIDRARGLGARIAWSTVAGGVQGEGGFPGGDVEFELFSMADAAITVGDVTLPPNPMREHVTLDMGFDVESSLVVVDAMTTYDRLRVQGARMLSCFSTATIFDVLWQIDRVLIEPAWAAADQVAYDAADNVGRKAPQFDRVYSRFRLPVEFDWTTEYDQKLNPQFTDNGEIDFDINASYMNTGHELRRDLPILEPRSGDAEDDEPGYMPMLALVRIPLDSSSVEDRGKWVTAHDAGADRKNGMLTPLSRELAFDLRYSPRHCLAKGHFGGAAPPTAPQFDYDDMVVTVCVETDTRPAVEMLLPQAGIGRERILTITVPDAAVWIIATGTAVGVKADGTLDIYQGDRILRDDTDRLRHIAALAKAVYGRHRRAVNVRYRGLRLEHPLGTYILAVWKAQVRHDVESVVTQRVMDYENNSTAIKTGFIELDFANDWWGRRKR
jgi:hypothetical protein